DAASPSMKSRRRIACPKIRTREPWLITSGVYDQRNGVRMSALGHKRTLRRVHSMSALPPIADIRGGSDYVRAVRLAAWRYSLRLIGVGAFAARGCKAC